MDIGARRSFNNSYNIVFNISSHSVLVQKSFVCAFSKQFIFQDYLEPIYESKPELQNIIRYAQLRPKKTTSIQAWKLWRDSFINIFSDYMQSGVVS